MDERYLSFTTFLKHRSAQITKFAQTLTQNTTKRSHQSLPKSIRRRAMSHNRYRIPLKMRKPLQNQLIKAESMQRLPKCRKSIRKKHRLILSYKERSKGNLWLKTHLWAAKRMKMGVYAGYKIAQSPNNKSFRSAYRYFRHNCCLMDYSYLQCLTITNNKHQLQFPPFIKFASSLSSSSLKTLNPYKFYSANLHNPVTNTLICPLIIFIQQPYKIICLFDPYALQQVNKIQWDMEKYTIQVGKGKCQVYLLIGPQAVSRVKQALANIIGVKGVQEEGLAGVDGNVLKVCKQQNSVIYIQDNNDKQQKVMNNAKTKPFISQSIQQKIIQSYDPQQNKKYRQMFFQSLKKSKSVTIQNKSQNNYKKSANFWQFYSNLSTQMQKQSQISKQYVMKITNRSKYTHKRKNKLSKQQKKIALLQSSQKKQKTSNITQLKAQKKLQQNQQSMKQQKLQQIQSKITQKIQPQTIHFNTTSTVTKIDPIILAPFKQFHSFSQSYQGCLLLCSSRDNCLIWNALSKTNVKVIGTKQWAHIMMESGKRLFPRDYVQSCCFQKYNKQRAMGLIERYRKLPKQKRPNYQKLLSPYPFYFHIQPQSTIVSDIKIRMIGRGRCFPGSYLYSLSSQDYLAISQQIQKCGTVKSILSQQPPSSQQQIKSIDYSVSTYEQIVQQLAVLNNRTKREMIGMATYGGFMMGIGVEGGFGYLWKKGNTEGNQGKNQEEINGKYVLVRKPTSRDYFVAQIYTSNNN